MIASITIGAAVGLIAAIVIGAILINFVDSRYAYITPGEFLLWVIIWVLIGVTVAIGIAK